MKPSITRVIASSSATMSSSLIRIATLFLIGTTASWAAETASELERHRALWSKAGLASYAYGYQKYCDCNRESPPETVVTVTADAITRVHHLHADSPREVPARDGSLDLYWTIDDLFALIESASARNAVVRVRYDDTRGFPTAIYIDYDAQLIGDELDLRITRFDSAPR